MKCYDCPYYYPTESGFTSCQWMPKCPDDFAPCEEEPWMPDDEENMEVAV